MKFLIKPVDIVYREQKVNHLDIILDFITETYPVEIYPKVLEKW